MLRVLHVTQSITASAGGTSTAFVELVEALRTQAIRGTTTVQAITQTLPSGDEAAKWIRGHEPQIWRFSGPPGRFSAGALGASAIELINSRAVDVVHLHGLWLIDLVAISAAARKAGIPVVWQPHGMLVRAALAHKRLKKLLFRHVLGLSRELRACSAAVFTSETERDTSDLSMLGKATRREVIPLPVPIPFSDEALPGMARAGRRKWVRDPADDPERTLVAGVAQPDLTSPLLVFMGRLHPVKRIELAISAMRHIREQFAGASLLLIGDGEPDYVASLKALAQREGVESSLIFAGWLSGDAKWRALAAGDALLIQSEFENFGYAIVEALVAGTPAVMTKNLSLAPAVVEIGAGAMADANPESLAKAALSVVSRGDRRDMGHRGRRWVEENFSREAVGRRLVEFYSSLIARSP